MKTSSIIIFFVLCCSCTKQIPYKKSEKNYKHKPTTKYDFLYSSDKEKYVMLAEFTNNNNKPTKIKFKYDNKIDSAIILNKNKHSIGKSIQIIDVGETPYYEENDTLKIIKVDIISWKKYKNKKTPKIKK